LFWWAAEAYTSVGPYRWAVVVLSVFYSCKFVCVSIFCERKWGFPRSFRGPLGLSPIGSLTMGCDDALEVEEFVIVGDCIDDMSGLSVDQHKQD
jgi:hypothetical protein